MNFGSSSYKNFYRTSKSFFSNNKQFNNMNFNNKFFSNYFNSKINTAKSKGMFISNYHLNSLFYFSNAYSVLSAFKFTQMLPVRSGNVNNDPSTISDSDSSSIALIDGINLTSILFSLLKGNIIILNDQLLAQLKEVLHKADVV